MALTSCPCPARYLTDLQETLCDLPESWGDGVSQLMVNCFAAKGGDVMLARRVDMRIIDRLTAASSLLVSNVAFEIYGSVLVGECGGTTC